MISRPKKSKAGSIVSSSARKMMRGLSKEEQLSKKILDYHKEKSLRIARDLEPILYNKEFGFYDKSLKFYESKLRALEMEKEQIMSLKNKKAKNDRFRKLYGERFRIITWAVVDSLKLILPYYYESDFSRFVALATLNGEQTMCKLYEFMNSPFPYTISFVIKSVVARSLPQLTIENYSRFVDPLFTLGGRIGLDLHIRVSL